MFEVHYTVAPSEVDRSYRHVHHATTLLFLERARLDFLASKGMPNEAFMEQNLFLVLSSFAINFKRELREEQIAITCENCRIDGKAILLEQRILNARGKEAVVAGFDLRFLSGEKKRSVVPPEDFVRRFLETS